MFTRTIRIWIPHELGNTVIALTEVLGRLRYEIRIQGEDDASRRASPDRDIEISERTCWVGC